jgi:Excalibur calcium-binding domain
LGPPPSIQPSGLAPSNFTKINVIAEKGKTYRCKQIGSWAKAQELLKQGHSYLDGDGDGEACESLK